MPKRNPDHLRREKLLFRYSAALERGDFDAIAEVLRTAENDILLMQMIDELQAAYQDESPMTLSLNGTKGSKPMSVYTPTYPTVARRVAPRQPALTLAAAMLAVFIMGGIILSLWQRPNTAGMNLAFQSSPTFVPSPTWVPTAAPPMLASDTVMALPNIYAVQSGDTLASIAAHYGVSAAEIERLNPGVVIQPGVALRIPLNVQPPSSFGIIACDAILTEDSTIYGFPEQSPNALFAANSPVRVSGYLHMQNGRWWYVAENGLGQAISGWVNSATIQVAEGCPLLALSVNSMLIVPSQGTVAMNPAGTIVAPSVAMIAVPTQIQPIYCEVYAPENVAVPIFTRPFPLTSGNVAGQAPPGDVVLGTMSPRILSLVHDIAVDGSVVWYYISTTVQDQIVVGWVEAAQVLMTSEVCPDTAPVQIAVVPTQLAPATYPQLTTILSAEAGLYAEPRSDAARLATLLQGTNVMMTQASGDGLWLQVVTTDAQTGWMLRSDLQTTTAFMLLPPTVIPPGGINMSQQLYTVVVQSGLTITGERVMPIIVRQEPAEQGAEVTTLPPGSAVWVMANTEGGAWFQVLLDGNVLGWLPAAQVQLVGTPITLTLDLPPDLAAVISAIPASAITQPQMGVVVVDMLPVYQQADEQSIEIVQLPRETRVIVLGQDADGRWLSIQVPDGAAGWVPNDGTVVLVAPLSEGAVPLSPRVPTDGTFIPAETVIPPMTVLPEATPTALFSSSFESNTPVMLLEASGDIPAQSLVRIISTWWDGQERYYEVQTDDGRMTTVRQSQLGFVVVVTAPPLDATSTPLPGN